MPSADIKKLRIWQDEPLLREVIERWESLPDEPYGFGQASLDIGILVGILTRREEQRDLGTSSHVELSLECEDLRAKVQYLVNFLQRAAHLPEGTFTFPDGDTWEPDGVS